MNIKPHPAGARANSRLPIAKKPSRLPELALFGGLILLVLASVLFGLSTGRVVAALDSDIALQLRLPRVLASLLIGAGAATAGTAMQGLFRNPLVSPSILGVSAGAGFGGALGIYLFPTSLFGILLVAFMGGLFTMLLTYGLARRGTNITVVLVGMSMGALFTALTSIIKFVADPSNKLPSIVFLLMGGLSGVSYQKLLFSAGPILFGVFGLYLVRWQLNVLSLGETEAHTLGIRVAFWRWWVIGCITLIVAASVALAGVIGWIGLVVPHIARMIVGPDHRVLLPASALLGGAYVCLMDTLTRTLTPTEIPLSILTTIIGALVFVYMLYKTQGRSWGND
jgi:iron complex transport system permease protein